MYNWQKYMDPNGQMDIYNYPYQDTIVLHQ